MNNMKSWMSIDRWRALLALLVPLLIPVEASGQMLNVGYEAGSNETVVVESGSFTGATVGYYGTGTLVNNGANIGGIHVGWYGNGTYIQNGNCTVGAGFGPNQHMIVNYAGFGAVIQNAGTVSVAGTLSLSFRPFGTGGFYTLNNGTLITGTTSLGSYDPGVFTHTGGLHRTNELEFAHPGSGVGTYLLSGGTLTVTNSEAISLQLGFRAVGWRAHRAGVVHGGVNDYFFSRYTLSGGTLSIGRLSLDRYGIFEQTGGTLYISDSFYTEGVAARFGDARWNPGVTYTAYGGAATFTMDSGGAGARNLSMDIRPSGTRNRPEASISFESSQHLASFSLGAGKTTLTPGGNKVLNTSVLDLAGTLDLNDNGLVWDYTGISPINTLRAWIGTARYGPAGPWTAPGITSSLADTTTWGIGYREWPGTFGIFQNEQIDGAALVALLTRYGDADLSGVVNALDVDALAHHWQGFGYWSDGDFNYDAIVDIHDLRLLGLNWHGTQQSLDEVLAYWRLPSVPVPEPAAAAALCCLLVLWACFHSRVRHGHGSCLPLVLLLSLAILPATARAQSTGSLDIGSDPGSNETFTLSTGTIDVENINIGGGRNGTLIHSGGNLLASFLTMAWSGNGTYLMSGTANQI